MMTLAAIFSSQNYFRWKYLDVISFAVSLSIYIWVRVENSLQQLNCQRISCNSNRLRKGCESNKGDQLTRALKKRNPRTFALIQVMKIFGKYLYISNVKFTMKGCRDKIVVFWLFSKEDPKFLHAKFQVYLTSPSGFFTDKSKKYTQYLTFFDKEKHLAQNLGNFESSKKGLNIIGSKMGAHKGFTFGHFLQTSISLISLLAP